MRLSLAIFLAGTALGLAGPAAAAAADWQGYANTYDSQRYSPLDRITPANAATLRPLCEIALGDDGAFEAGPLMVGGTLYVTTSHTTVALDPAGCTAKWRHVYRADETEVLQVNRGAAYLAGTIFRGTADGHLLAIDANTGKELWRVRAGDPKKGEYFSAAPIAWNGKIFIGPAGSEFGIRGRVAAFDTSTGKELWRFNTIPTGDEPGAETWHIPETAVHGGGANWTSYTLDPGTGELFVSVANPAPDFSPDARPGDNLYTDSMVVLDANTGKLKWYYQVSPNDGFDWDLGAAPMLFLDRAGRRRVALGSKDGHVYVLDRDTHKLLYKTPVTTIFNADKRPTSDGVRACPGTLGGVEWNGPSYSPLTGMLYVGAVDWCQFFKSGMDDLTGVVEGVPASLKPYVGTNVTTEAGEPKSGWITAIDASSGSIKWRYHAPNPIVAGVTATAGGVVFAGDMGGQFFVFDAKDGKVLSSSNLGGALAGGIITYQVKGKQYVALTAGNIGRSTFNTSGTPRLVILTTGLADNVKPAKLIIEQPEKLAAAFDPQHGKTVFGQFCSGCHGLQGEGIPGAGVDIRNESERKDHKQLLDWIKNPAPPMPRLYPAPLRDDDVESVANFIETLTN